LFESGAAIWGEEAVVTDLDEAAGEDVLEEEGDEFLRWERPAPDRACAGVDVSEGDAVVLEALDAFVGEGDAVDVASQILGDGHAIASVLDLEGPATGEESPGDTVQETGSLQAVADLGPEDDGDGVSREEEVTMCGKVPSVAVLREPADGDEEMDVGVVIEVAGPGVEDGEDAGSSSNPVRVLGDGQDGGGGGLLNEGVDLALMGAGEAAKFGGEGEGDQSVTARKKESLELLAPDLGRLQLAARAVAVTAGVVGVVDGATVVAGEDGTTERGSSAADDVVHGAPVGGQHPLAELLAVGGTCPFEDRREAGHGLRVRAASSID